MAADVPEICELDVNSLLVDEAGVLAADARVAVGFAPRKFDGSGPVDFAILPYPSQWQLWLESSDGQRFVARPIRSEDEPACSGRVEQGIHSRVHYPIDPAQLCPRPAFVALGATD